MVTFDKLRSLALRFPETSERLCWETPTFYVRKKLFARLLEDGVSLAIKTTDLERMALCQLEPETFSVPPHYANYPMFVIQLRTIEVDELERLLDIAWRLVAPKKLLATL